MADQQDRGGRTPATLIEAIARARAAAFELRACGLALSPESWLAMGADAARAAAEIECFDASAAVVEALAALEEWVQ